MPAKPDHEKENKRNNQKNEVSSAVSFILISFHCWNTTIQFYTINNVHSQYLQYYYFLKSMFSVEN